MGIDVAMIFFVGVCVGNDVGRFVVGSIVGNLVGSLVVGMAVGVRVGDDVTGFNGIHSEILLSS